MNNYDAAMIALDAIGNSMNKNPDGSVDIECEVGPKIETEDGIKHPWEIVLDRMIFEADKEHIDSWWNPFSRAYKKWILLCEVKRQIECEPRNKQ